MSEMFSQMSGVGTLTTVMLVDGENIPHALAGQMIAKSLGFGRPIVQRVYGDVTRLPSWEAAAGFEMIHTGHAKNGADMRMVIDALDLVHCGGVGRVVLASSDRDFTHLAQYLRAKGIEVLGMGEAKTHDCFRKACSRFVELGTVAKPVFNLDEPDMQIEALIKAEGKAGMPITALSIQMRMKHGFLIGQHDLKNWRGYLSAKPEIYDLDPKGPTACVRLRCRVSPN